MAKDKQFKKRLFKVSKELNVSTEALVQHLKDHGYAAVLDGSGLNASITDEEAYDELLAAFATDREAAARVSEKRAQRRAEAEAQDEAEVEEAPAVVEAKAPAKPAPPPPEPEEEVAAPEEVDEVPVAQEVPPAEVEAVAEVEEAPEPVAAEQEVSEVAEEPVAEAEAAATAEEAPTEEDEEAEPVAPAMSSGDGEDDEAVLSATRYKLAGTKVVGKIDLNTVEESGGGRKRKRKRKRKAKASEPDEGALRPQKSEGDAQDAAKRRRKRKRGPVVDEADVEATLQETLRELEQGASRLRQRRRRQRRDERAVQRQQQSDQEAERARMLRVTEFVSTGELANLMGESVSDVIGTLFKAGMMVSINQRLDADTISFVADEYGFEVEFITEFGTDDIEYEDDEPEDLAPRAPVVTVMGHVDHGKTSLLDYIRSANVVGGEAGGITQHIGAYHLKLPDEREITFLDTPGHEAFTAMRARGAKVTDVVILVVAADDSVMPQTIEAINHARAAEVPLVVAINKVDKADANPQRVMQQLADQNVLVEQYGGKVQCALVSAKTGEGIDDLLDKVLLEAELLQLQANPDRNAAGVVIESRMEKGLGNVATVLVQNGTLEVGDTFVAGIYSGRVRVMFDERDNRIEDAGPAEPALVIGFDGAPEVGDQFIVLDDERMARDIAQRRQQIHREQALRQRKHITLDEIGRRLALGDFQELNLIIKADVGGSVEALTDALLKLSTEEVAVNIIHSGVGAITENDIMLASASDAVIIGFQVRPAVGARSVAEREEVEIRTYSIIYDAIEDVRDALEGLLSPEETEKTVGTAEVREVFRVPKAGTIAGCYVVEGKIRRNDRIRIVRDGVVIYEGGISSLRRFKDDVREVQNGYECGIGIENYNDIKVGDQFETYEIVETKRKLEV